MMIESPRMTSSGNPLQDLQVMRSYLFRISEQINVALDSLDTKVVNVQMINTKKDKSEIDLNDVMSLIVKTADSVTELDGYYQALESEYGSFTEKIAQTFEETDEYIKQNIDYTSNLEVKLAGYGEVENYVVETQNYIKSGLLYYDDLNMPVVGIAIGENLARITRENLDTGEEEEILERVGQYATFTSSELAFYDGAVKVAYVSKGVFHMVDAEIDGYLKQRNWKQVTTDNSWTLKWEG